LKAAGKLNLEVTFLPFYEPVFDDEDERERDLAQAPTRRLVTHNVPDNLKVSTGFMSLRHPLSQGWLLGT